jgi:GNAT superfamily N-acetyltransferase
LIKQISFTEVCELWKQLWPNREIDTHSTMRYNDDPYPAIREMYEVTYFGYFDKNKLLGVNSGHATSRFHYRSRGLFVLPEYRKNGIGIELLKATIDKSKEENTKICWSIPRKQSINTYTTAGFIKDSHWFSTETNEENCIVIKKL